MEMMSKSAVKDSVAPDEQSDSDQNTTTTSTQKSYSRRYVADRPPTMGRGIGSGSSSNKNAEERSNRGTFIPHRCTPQQLQEEVSNVFQLEQLASGSIHSAAIGSNSTSSAVRIQQSTMAPSIRDYVNYGAEDEDSVRRNRTGFARFALRPRVLLKNVSVVNTCTTILQGRVRLSMPLCVAPFAGCSTIHAEGRELAIARAAANAGIVYTIPNFSGTPVRDLVNQRHRRHLGTTTASNDGQQPAPFFFQVYPQKPKSSSEGIDRNHMEALLQYLSSLGDNGNHPIVGIIVTCDTPNNGNRELTYKNTKWLEALDKEVGGFPEPCALQGAKNLPPISEPGHSASMTWDDIKWMKRKCLEFRFALILKGIMTREDTKLAVEVGVDAVIVSNHGGRQLDGTLGTIEAVEECVRARGSDDMEIYVDGGIRRGKDIAKCLALGAKCVFVGRPILWGLAAGDEQGVDRVLEIYRQELITVLQLLGCCRPQELTRNHVVRDNEWQQQHAEVNNGTIMRAHQHQWILAALGLAAAAFALGRYSSR